ncbi:MAG: Fe(2+) transporter permease subunit FeoB [Armatimonadetes bacterium]|nr:Fe(2+) transporter permease subunit FeoB [Armatimonadota bacterium]
MKDQERTIALVGNPNCGKTTLFNALTGRDQRVGNWPGVTVEKKEGRINASGDHLRIVDLPGVYALLASSEDERVARDYILSGEPGLVVNIVDATNLERNLFLTTQLIDMGVPLVVVVNMIDLAEAQDVKLDLDVLRRGLGCPALAVAATRKRDVRRVLDAIQAAWDDPQPSGAHVPQPDEVEELASRWAPQLEMTARSLGTDGRWLALKLMERDGWATARTLDAGALTREQIDGALEALDRQLDDPADVVLAEARYRFIEDLTKKALERPSVRETRSDKADKVILNRVLGIPIFLIAMYVLFWFTISIGGAFIDFFDIVGGTVFVEGFGRLLEGMGSPAWLVTILATGMGAGVQTVLTFIPIIFVMFLGLTLLEDSGYMARAAFVMDRFMRWVGLPGKSFVPMLVGFGCNVPAIMATRTLENKRDRYMTIFMNPFMSCGARLPVYALFAAAFFGAAAGAITFSLYLVGIGAAILTGLLLKRTLFRGEPSHFVMELPPYHTPRMRTVMRFSWRRTLIFMTRAKYIVPIVAVLAILNSVGTDGSFGNEDSPESVLSTIGKTITPVFEPMGVEEENWPATVGIFTGIFAKEAVVGTLNSLYSQEAVGGEAEDEAFSFWGGVADAFRTTPDNLSGAPAGLIDPLGVGLVGGTAEEVAEEVGAGTSVYAGLRAGFSEGRPQAYAYLLFVLLYLPCVAAFGAMTREMGLRYSLLAVAYLAVTSWSVATLFYQVTVGKSTLWIVVALALLALMATVFWTIGRWARPIESRIGRPTAAAESSGC